MLFLSTLTYSQDISYQHFTIENGLPSNHVYDIYQDDDGFMWFATENGLSRYDGSDFKNYTILDGLPDTEILNFFEDTKKRVWLITFNGKMGYLKDGKFYNSKNTPFLKSIFFDDLITNVEEDKDGVIHFLSGNTVLQLNNQNSISKIKLKMSCRNLMKDKQGVIYYIPSNNFSTYYVLHSSNQEEVKIDFDKFDKENLLKLVYTQRLTIANIFDWSKQEAAKVNESRESFFLRQKNNLWLFGSNIPLQVIELNGDNIKSTRILNNIQVSIGIIDRDNNLWFGSAFGNGVYKLNPSISEVYKAGEHLEGNLLNSFFIDKSNGTIYCGTNDGFVNIISNNKIESKRIEVHELGISRIRSIGKGKFGNIWVVNDAFLGQLNRNLSLGNQVVRGSPKSLHINTENNQAFLSTSKGCYQFRYDENGIIEANKIFDKRSMYIHIDSDSTIWIGTNRGLYFSKSYNLDKPFFEKIEVNAPITNINNIDSTLLVATKGEGILSIKNGKLKRITTDDGLASNLVRSIFVHDDKTIWISTNEGLSKMQYHDGTNFSFVTLNEKNGLLSDNVLDFDIMDSTLFVLCPQGISKLNLNEIDAAENAPQIKIEQVLVNNIPLEKDSISTLSYQQNNITIDFSGIYFSNRKNLDYTYKLKGYHQDWQRTKSNNLVFEQLPPGKYTLELFASINNNKNTRIEKLSFEIIPAFYQRRAVQLLGLILGSVLLFYLTRRRFEKEREKSKIENRLLQLEQIALQSQMNPHFIKNSLGAIQHLMIKKDIRSANKYLIVFGELITQLLKQSDQSMIKISDEIQILELYLSIEKLRFDNNFEYSIKCDSEEILDRKIPSMMIQPLAENSILHGFRDLGNKRQNELKIYLTPKDDYIICLVEDNGEGFNPYKAYKTIFTKKEGIALNNIKERISLLSTKNPKTSFDILRSNNTGTSIQLCLPIKEDYD